MKMHHKLLIVLLSMAQFAFAQQDQTKKIYIGGELSLTTGTSTTSGIPFPNNPGPLFVSTASNRSSAVLFQPFIMGQHRSSAWDFGLGLHFSYQKIEDGIRVTPTETEDISTSRIGVGMIGRRWLFQRERLRLFMQGSLNVLVGQQELGSISTTDELSFFLNTSFGGSYRVGKRLRMTASLPVLHAGLIRTTEPTTDASWRDVLSLRAPNGLPTLGVEYIF